MTLKQIKNWMKSANFIVTDFCESDSDGNNWARDIFEKNGKHYVIRYFNGQIVPECEKGECGGLVKTTVYLPKEIDPPKEQFGITL